MTLFALLLCLVNQSFASSDEPWLFSRDTGLTKTWKLKGQKGVYVSKTVKTSNVPDLEAKLKKQKYVQQLNGYKRKMLEMVGVKSWKMTNSKWLKAKGFPMLEVTGSYIDSSNKEVFFRENHIFLKRKVLRLLFVGPRKERALTRHYQQFLSDQIEKI